MDYHLARDGKQAGVFSLEELRRRRDSGELTGTEVVWCPGMTYWQALDTILQPAAPAPLPRTPPPLPPPVPAHRSDFLLVWIVVGGCVVFLVVMPLLAFFGMRAYLRLRRAAYVSSYRQNAGLSSQPITWTSNTLTEVVLQKRRKEFRLRQWVEGYEKYGLRDEPCDAEARQYLATWIGRSYGGDDATNLPPTDKWGDMLVAQPGCTDAVVLTSAGIFCNELHEKGRRLQLALDAFEHTRHLAYPKFCAAAQLATDLDELKSNADRVSDLDWDALKFLREAFTDGSLGPDDQTELAELFIVNWGKGLLYRKGEAVCSLIRSQGKPYEWLALTLEGQHQINEAWRSRGGGYANTVTEEGWRGFNSHLAEARKTFTKAWELRPDLALAPALMITVAMGQSNAAELRLWFNRALTAQIDNRTAWGNMQNAMRARWFGSMDDLLALGVSAVDTKRFDTDVPRKIIDMVKQIEQDMDFPPGRHLFGREDIWPHLQQMYEGYLQEPSRLRGRDGWRSSYAVVAYLAGRYDVARTQLAAMDWQPQAFSLTEWGRDLSLMAPEVAARTGPEGGQVGPAESSYTNGRVADAWQRYTTIASATNLDERTKQFVEERLAALELEKRLQQGQWVEFLPARDNDPVWEANKGSYQRLADGSVEVHAGPEGHVLFPRVPVGPDFEVKGEFDVVSSSTKSFQAGLLMGAIYGQGYWYSFRMKRNDAEGQVVSFAMGWSADEVAKPVILDDKHNTFYFRLRNGKASATLNGQEILHEVDAPRAIHVDDRGYSVALGAYNDTNDTVLRYRNVQLRKLVPGVAAEQSE